MMCMHAMNHQEQHREEAPLDIIKRRYARGEINREQFEQLKRDLGLHEAHSHDSTL